MQTIAIPLDDELFASLEELCRQQQRERDQVLLEVVRRYVSTEQLRRELERPDLIELYAELGDEDVHLAEVGMSDLHSRLSEVDQP